MATISLPPQQVSSPCAPPATAPAVPPISAEMRADLDRVVADAQRAAAAFRKLDQAQVDRIVWAMVVAGLEAAVELAEHATRDTGFGVFEDKVIKNYVATEFLHEYLKDKKTVGVIEEDVDRGISFVADPIGVVLAVLPITNPTSTLLFKAIVAAKTRNAIVFRPSAKAASCAMRGADILRAAGERAGLPPGALQVVPEPSLDASAYLFRHRGVDLLWVTGGPKVVEAANQSGKPTIAGGPGNAPVYLHRSCDVRMAVMDILVSKTFDASVICPAEQTCVIDEPIYEQVVAEFQRMGARLLDADEVAALARVAYGPDGRPNLALVGQPCGMIGMACGFRVDPDSKILMAPLPRDLAALAVHPLIHEKLMPVLSLVNSPNVGHALSVCELVTETGGLGHTSAVYARDREVVDAFALRVRTGRILVNAPTAVGALGGVYNSLTPTFSLGCGSWGGSSTTENVNYKQLLNIKTVSRRITPPQWFRVPSDTYFNLGAIENLRRMPITTALVVTDEFLERRGYVEEIRRQLPRAAVHAFSNIPPEPTEEHVRQGIEALRRVSADTIIAIGGGSVLDAAKAMKLFHASPQLTLRELALPFLDARKRVAQYPQMEHGIRLIAVPTTAGTGSEVSPAAVITVGDRKVTLVDYSLVPNVAIVDPHFTMSMPPTLTADTGVDALTHALEALVSIFASPYTDAFCLQAIHLILEALPRAVRDGDDVEARTMMANAATLAGLAFSNAFVGVTHALAHPLGARFKIAHGRANGILLPYTLRYNAEIPRKFMPAPGYTTYVAPDKLAQAAWVLSVGGGSDEHRRQRLFERIESLLRTVGIPRSLAEAGIPEAEFRASRDELTRAAFADPSLRTNPRIPLIRELQELLDKAYVGATA
jgi:acetaldehyde dehydrogenase/alcohol dehydrogenase